MGGEGSGRRPDPIKKYVEQKTPIATTNSDAIIMPDYSGVAQHKATLEKFDNRYAAYGTTGGTGGGGSLWMSGSNFIYPKSGQNISGSGFITENTISGGLVVGVNITSGDEPGHTHSSISAAGGGLWTSGSGFIYPIDTSLNVSGSGFITSGTMSGSAYIDANIDHDALKNFAANEHFTEASIDHTAISNIGTNTHAQLDTGITNLGSLSGSHFTHTADSTIHYVDPGFLTAETDPIFGAMSGSLPYASDTLLNDLSGSYHLDSTGLSGSIQANDADISGLTTLNTSLSGSAFTHINDNTQAHSDYLLNNAQDVGVGLTLTGLSGANILNTGDHNTSGSAFVVGVIMDPSATPPTASNFPQGTIYLQYTA